MNILITGGCEFIGSNLAVSLTEAGHAVTCFDNLSRRGSEALLQRILTYGCAFAYGDIRNPEDLVRISGDFDVMIECSAEPSALVGAQGADAAFMVNNNLVGSLNCFELARQRGMSVLFFSTSRVYPYTTLNSLRFTESETRVIYADNRNGVSARGVSRDFPLAGSRSLYGATKLASELILQEYSTQYQLPAIINRCGVIAGPWQLGKVDQGVFTFWLVQHYFGKSLRYIGFGGKGKQVRDLLHVDDLCALVKIQMAQINTFRGEVFNVGGSLTSNLSLAETTAICQEITGNQVDITASLEDRPADIIWFLTDNTETEQTFDWRAWHSGKQVLEDTYVWLRENEQTFINFVGRQ